MLKFGTNVKELRVKAGLSVEDLVISSAVKCSTIKALEAGRMIKFDAVARIAIALKVGLKDLVYVLTEDGKHIGLRDLFWFGLNAAATDKQPVENQLPQQVEPPAVETASVAAAPENKGV